MNATEVKDAVYDRDGGACISCGMPNNLHRVRFGRSLHVHRIAKGVGYTMENCELVCMHCHHNRHGADGPRRIHMKLRRRGSGIHHLKVEYLNGNALAALESICREFGLYTTMAIDIAIALLEVEAEKIRNPS